MFLENKYTNWYYSIINKAKNRIISCDVYYEKHHIIPKSLGGKNSQDNLVSLTGKEHFIVHMLLVRMTNGDYKRKMSFALWRMVHGNKNQIRFKISSKTYNQIKQNMSRASTEQNKIRGNSYMTDEIRSKLSNKVPWNKGRKMGKEFSKKMSTLSKNRKFSIQTRQKLSMSSTGKPKPKFQWILKNTNTGETEITNNLKEWCKNKGFNTNLIYRNKSVWIIIEKCSFKTGDKLL